MTVTLPLANSLWPVFRLLTRPRWEGKAASAGGWQIQPMNRRGLRANGFDLVRCSRGVLPFVGKAELRFRYGLINGSIVAPDDASAAAIKAGNQWQYDSMDLSVPDLTDKEIRIQAARPTTDGTAPAWKTIWWGTCEYQLDSGWPGSPIPAGERIYHCFDGFYRTKHWQMNRHGFYSGFSSADNAKGHPGYNVSPFNPGRISGNKSSDGAGYTTEGGIVATQHTMPGTGDYWTDLEAIEHAMAATRPTGEPQFLMAGSTDLLGGIINREVRENMPVWDFVASVCRRQRGRGIVFVDWDDDTGAASGPLTVKLTVRPQFVDSFTYTDPTTGLDTTVQGATGAGTTVSVDLIGDHRCVDEVFAVGERHQNRVDYVESQGEQIQVLVTTSILDDGWDKRWTDTFATTFRGLDPSKRIDEKYGEVYQFFGLKRGFGGVVKDGDQTSGRQVRCDYRCNDSGDIVAAAGQTDTSEIGYRVMDDLPIYDGYSYTGAIPARADGEAETGRPNRRPAMPLIRAASNSFLKIDEIPGSISFKMHEDGVLIYDTSDQASGGRYLGDPAYSTLSSVYKYDQIVWTLGIELPHRVRIASGDPAGRRKLIIEHKDRHLWLATPGAIWDLDTASRTATGSPALRAACHGDTPGNTTDCGILRDDRAALARDHAIAWRWYGEDRRNATWGLRDCCMLASFDEESGATAYPGLGDLVTSLTAAGRDHEPNTPITMIEYDNQTGSTVFTSDWSELDFDR